jgi:hypothetical protein
MVSGRGQYLYVGTGRNRPLADSKNRPLNVGCYFVLAEAARLQDSQKNVSPYCDETFLKPDGRLPIIIAEL